MLVGMDSTHSTNFTIVVLALCLESDQKPEQKAVEKMTIVNLKNLNFHMASAFKSKHCKNSFQDLEGAAVCIAVSLKFDFEV